MVFERPVVRSTTEEEDRFWTPILPGCPRRQLEMARDDCLREAEHVFLFPVDFQLKPTPKRAPSKNYNPI